MICGECINRRPKEGYGKSSIHLDAKEERRASYEKIYFIIYYDAFISFIMEWGEEKKLRQRPIHMYVHLASKLVMSNIQQNMLKIKNIQSRIICLMKYVILYRVKKERKLKQ